MAKRTFAARSFKARTFQNATWAGEGVTPAVTKVPGAGGGGEFRSGSGIPIPAWMLVYPPRVRAELYRNLEMDELLFLCDFDVGRATELMRQADELRERAGYRGMLKRIG